ncbi:MAG: hypothetical protein LC725_09295, partial [Lentisphaerae bacterium]|nr:hypothetical protein [Lentisphaerota bacterium]
SESRPYRKGFARTPDSFVKFEVSGTSASNLTTSPDFYLPQADLPAVESLCLRASMVSFSLPAGRNSMVTGNTALF